MQTFKIWYQKPEFFAHGGVMGYDFLRSIGQVPDPQNLDATHIYVKDVQALDLVQVFHAMQGDIWLPNGEARELVLNKGLRHTSMCIGDIAVWELFGRTYLVDRVGWKDISGAS